MSIVLVLLSHIGDMAGTPAAVNNSHRDMGTWGHRDQLGNNISKVQSNGENVNYDLSETTCTSTTGIPV